ncbi:MULTISPECIES: glycoside hydrolase family 5 protein [Xanthomonas]|uniref:Endoglucanase n=1 Tax=Xanthomonas phaseoli pv. dieffenbachiae TaxID=92828 RepID=A0A1V9HAQ9_9XANT|nr:glycoside hydrolase family 5 protein [Xanthomonas phaseoli]MBO9766095.1 glycoside hydrolase family 5 protein [Xanthomonas phaseoli pv. dieffenbachiae]MBO9775803.1 glycoside hydrolase family 5 protein [Xanthomonas phaseoli pv. dieffenbachiae]MBO9780833.1 glycoside hydrolase family 5 protein [Xanthomonas phaseoli pv. dieffenbachiae]MBO9789288.1 glycoside hydrolase family 5 protein [Xanthomonas phaseoli pv. dieffenbachiae]MBO9798098.1 glycoside hydrolase family 5 protein [Xanthomonas phaseoli 
MFRTPPHFPRLRIAALALTLLAAGPLVQAKEPPGPRKETAGLKYVGVNLSGAEFNSRKKPGTLFKDYTYPAASDFSYFAGKGMNTIRLPFLWERVQPELNGQLDQAQLGLIKKSLEAAKANKQYLILDLHNYATYNGKRIGTSDVPAGALADLWRRLALEFKDDKAVIFGLMNEPNGISAPDWANAAQGAINAIRKTAAKNLILVPGTAYTGAHSWRSTSYGVSNAKALEILKDPGNNLAFEAHQYLDKDYSGTKPVCISDSVGQEKLQGFTSWLRENKQKGFLGEFATANNPVCDKALEGMLTYMEKNSDVWLGWTWWAAGSWWKPDYPFTVQPGKDGSDKPQMAILSKYARRAGK